MRTILNNTKVTERNRQLQNLNRLLVKSEFKEINILPSVSKCNEPRCAICNYFMERSSLKLNNKVVNVKENMNCNVKKNALYVLICNGCREYYIGQTGDKLRNRRIVHDQQTRDPTTRQLPLGSHLEQCSLINPKFFMFLFFFFFFFFFFFTNFTTMMFQRGYLKKSTS